MNGVAIPGSDLEDDAPFDPETDDFLHLTLLKERTYRHFDDAIPESVRKFGVELKSFPQNHRFLPLLGFTDIKRRVFRDSTGKLVTKKKPRDIRYASHQDAAYIQAYAENLSKIYESKLLERELENCVLAYRPTGRTNIHHAKSLFDEIISRNCCNVIAIDISGFFDSLNHAHLKGELSSIIGTKLLDGHDWNIFQNVTKFSWVDLEDIDKILGKNRKMGSRICTPNEFKNFVRGVKKGIVKRNDNKIGIPQGTPISGLYANIYMITFDTVIKKLMDHIGGSYRRYSDDIAVVVPTNYDPSEVVKDLEKILLDFGLKLSNDKTDIAVFDGPPLKCDRHIQYLGFVFNGSEIRIRESSLDSYRDKMQSGIRAKILAAKKKKIAPTKIYKREVLSRYTHLGRRRNFLKYAFQAADILEAPEIRKQLKGHMRWFVRSWNRELASIYR